MKKFVASLALAALFVPAAAFAQEHPDHHHRPAHVDPHWHGDIHSFGAHDLGYWHSGSWFHGAHGGRNGWWWIVGGVYYFYPAPVYPYPDPYLPPAVTPVAGGSFWYYCRHPQGYYPYIPVCYGHWHAVPTAVAAAPAPVIAAPPAMAAPPPAPSAIPEGTPVAMPPP